MTSMPQPTWAIIPAGGTGQRFVAASGNPAFDKLLVELAGIPVLVRTVKQVLRSKSIDGAIISAPFDKQTRYQDLLKDTAISKPVHVVCGGDTRRESVWNALQHVPEAVAIVVVHDAARPLIDPILIDQAIHVVTEGYPAAMIGLSIRDTVKYIDPEKRTVVATLDRTRLWHAQTPQVFLKSVLQQAHQTCPKDTPVTDDVQLLEIAGLGPVCLIEGQAHNLKITTPDDILLATSILQHPCETWIPLQ